MTSSKLEATTESHRMKRGGERRPADGLPDPLVFWLPFNCAFGRTECFLSAKSSDHAACGVAEVAVAVVPGTATAGDAAVVGGIATTPATLVEGVTTIPVTLPFTVFF